MSTTFLLPHNTYITFFLFHKNIMNCAFSSPHEKPHHHLLIPHLVLTNHLLATIPKHHHNTHKKTNKLGSSILVTKLPLLTICTTTKLTHNIFILSTKTLNSYFATFKQSPKVTSLIFVDDYNFCIHWMHLTLIPLSHLQKKIT